MARRNIVDRYSTLENILRTPIPLREYLMAVIIPESLADDISFRTFCENLGKDFDVMLYDDSGELNALKCNRRLDKVLLQYYLDKGYISI